MMSTPKLPLTASTDTSTKVMGLALRDVNASLAGSLGIAEGTTEYVNLTNNVSATVENFIGEGSAISTTITEELALQTDRRSQGHDQEIVEANRRPKSNQWTIPRPGGQRGGDHACLSPKSSIYPILATRSRTR